MFGAAPGEPGIEECEYVGAVDLCLGEYPATVGEALVGVEPAVAQVGRQQRQGLVAAYGDEGAVGEAVGMIVHVVAP